MEYSQHYPTDQPRQDATSRDQARQVATGDDYISIKETLAIFIEQGRPVTERTLQRYCDKNQLTGQKVMTGEGEKWFVLKISVFNRLAELQEFDRLRASRQDATSRDLPSIVAEHNTNSFEHDNSRQATEPDSSPTPVAQEVSHTTTPDLSRPDAASRDLSRQVDETVQHLNMPGISERERELYEQLLATYKDRIEDLVQDKNLLQEDKKMLVEQLLSKDKQIEHFFSSERDTKKLFGSLQNIMTYLWPGSKRQEPSEKLPQAYGQVVRDMPDGLDDHHEGSDR
jgi:hypothetical protein